MIELDANAKLLSLTSDIVSAHVSANSVAASDLPGLIVNVYAALSGVGKKVVPEEVAQEPAVPIRSSIKPQYIVCLEDGKKLKMLRRYLMTRYSLTPDAYRAKWKLPVDYPMVAPAYAEQRRNLALAIGLGRNAAPEQPLPLPEDPPTKTPRLQRTKLAPVVETKK